MRRWPDRQTKPQRVISPALRFSVLITMDRRIELVISKIDTETSCPWDTATLAALISLSPSRFRHLFKAETGMTPARYLKEFRLRKAERMLQTTFLSVKQIVKLIGLGSHSNFVHDFRRIHGMTPTAYRRLIWQHAKAKQSRKRKR